MDCYQEEHQRICQSVKSTTDIAQQWANGRVFGTQHDLRRHDLNKRQREEEIVAMKENLSDLERTQLQEQSVQCDLKEVVATARRQLMECDEERGDLQEALEKADAKRTRMEGQLEERRQNAKKEEAGVDSRRVEIDAYLGLFARCLGLSLAVVPPRSFRFAFTLLSDECPNKVHAFTLTYGRPAEEGSTQAVSGGYVVTDCNPEVDDLAALVEELNAAPDQRLPSFICKMRAAFKVQLRKGSPHSVF